MSVTRAQMWAAMGIIPPDAPETKIAELTESIYADEARAAWARTDEAPHGHAWHTSFHASKFPGGEKGCARQQVYGLMNFPDKEPAPAWLSAVADAGKDIEVQIVTRWHRAGILLSKPPWAEHQTNFKLRGHWLTCSLDAALDLRPGWPWVHPVDVKGKDHEVILAMQRGEKGPDEGHVNQVNVQAWFCRQAHQTMGWADRGLHPAKASSLLYVSRQRPMTMHEFLIPLDEDRIWRGLEVLEVARKAFEAGVLPGRPKEWRWTEDPCKWCSYKKGCKADLKGGRSRLEESELVTHALDVSPAYDFATVREAVIDRWRDTREGGKAA